MLVKIKRNGITERGLYAFQTLDVVFNCHPVVVSLDRDTRLSDTEANLMMNGSPIVIKYGTAGYNMITTMYDIIEKEIIGAQKNDKILLILDMDEIEEKATTYLLKEQNKLDKGICG